MYVPCTDLKDIAVRKIRKELYGTQTDWSEKSISYSEKRLNDNLQPDKYLDTLVVYLCELRYL